MRRLAPCRQVRRVQALPSEESTHLSGLRAPVRFFDDPQLIRRIEPAAQRLIYYLRVRRGCRASLSLPGSRSGTILFHSLSQSQHDRFLCLRPTLIPLRALCLTYVGREGTVLNTAWTTHPERFVRGVPKPKPLPEAVWINPPTTPLSTQEIAL